MPIRAAGRLLGKSLGHTAAVLLLLFGVAFVLHICEKPLRGVDRESLGVNGWRRWGSSATVMRTSPKEENFALQVLFVGNSFVHYNEGVDKVVADLLEERLGRLVRAERYAPGGYSWSQHVADAHDEQHVLYRLLGPGGSDRWNFVVFQEQSQSPGLGGGAYQGSWTALEDLVGLAKARGAVSVLMMTWGYREGDPAHPDLFPSFAAMQERVGAGYWKLAEKVRQRLNTPAFVAPAGLAWARVRELEAAAKLGSQRKGQNPESGDGLPYGSASFGKLYSGDGIHPSPAGTFLAACVVAASLTGCRMEGANVRPEGLSPRWPRFLQTVADWAVHEGTPEGAPHYPWTPAAAC